MKIQEEIDHYKNEISTLTQGNVDLDAKIKE